MARNCLVLGSALCVWSDIEAALDLGEFHGVVAAKKAGTLWKGELDGWVSLHPARFDKEIMERKRHGYPDAKALFVYSNHPSLKRFNVTVSGYNLPEQKTSGSSGLYAVKVALHDLAFDRVVLCGIPLDKKAGRIEDGPHWAGSESFKRGFQQVRPYLKDRARSMSGWTAELLGRPTSEWLET